MRQSQSLYLLGDTAPAEHFGRVARTIPAPQRLTTASTESANAAHVSAHHDVDAMNAVARRAMGANGFGDANLGEREAISALDRYSLHAAARAHRSRVAGELLTSILRSAFARIRGLCERYRRHVEAQAIYRELAGLDSRTLLDIGIHHRSELRFVAQRLAHGEDLHEFHGQR
jgi:uncharacterized protein YjiS (DUF1127 family)